jgi:polyisoprenoid-binding protein YceI
VRKLNIALAGVLSLTAAMGLAQTTTTSIASSSVAQTSAPKGQPNTATLVKSGTYKVDPNHTQVLWSVDHMGFSRLHGMVGSMTGKLDLDPARLAQSRLDVEIPLSGLTLTSSGFSGHLQTADLFDVAKFPTARFVSQSVVVRGQQATITGNLTLKGVTKPVVLEARFYGAGRNPMSKAQTVGFSAKGQLKRSDFNLGYAVPAVSDLVDLEINAAFEQVSS